MEEPLELHEAISIIRFNTWECRDEIMERMLTHEDSCRLLVMSGILVCGWTVESFVSAWAADDPELLRDQEA